MKRVIAFLLVVAIGFAWYSSTSKKNKEAARLKAEVAELRKEKDALSNPATVQGGNSNSSAQGKVAQSAADQSRIKDLQNQFNTETSKLISLQRRKDQLTSAVNDPGQASSVSEAQEEIREKNDAIQSLQLQLTNNQADEKMVDHNGETARQYQNLNKVQNIADLNLRIRAQQNLIKNTQDAIRANRVQATADSNNMADALMPQLAQQKVDLEAMRLGREQVNVNSAAQSVQIHEQVGVVKNNIRIGDQEIRAQIAALKNDIKTLQAQSSGANRTTSQLKDQMNHVDQQISSEKIVIDRLQKLLGAETAK